MDLIQEETVNTHINELVKPNTNSNKESTKHKKPGLFMANVLTRKINLDFNNVGNNIKELLQLKLVESMEGKCVVEGFIKNNSIRVIKYSSGELVNKYVQFVVVFECLICNPVENQRIKVRALNITKAGIRAEAVTKSGDSPVDVFIARDHNYKNSSYASIKEGDEFNIRIIGQRYEINDTVISVLGELFIAKKKLIKKKPILVIGK